MENKIQVFSPKQIESLPLHQDIINFILSKPVYFDFNYSNLLPYGKGWSEEAVEKHELKSGIFDDKIIIVVETYSTETYLTLYENVESFIDKFPHLILTHAHGIRGDNWFPETDAYGTKYWYDQDGKICAILNNYDSSFFDIQHDDIKNRQQDGARIPYITVFGFATLFDGIVRFTEIVYHLKYRKLLVRDDVCYKLPFKPELGDFIGKRATYRLHSTLSLRTVFDVYLMADKRYHQTDDHKDQSSYPRLLLF